MRIWGTENRSDFLVKLLNECRTSLLMKLKRKQLMQLNGVIFLIVAILHGLRVLNDWGVIVADWQVPMWLSYLIVVLAGYLLYQNWNMAQ